MSIEQYLNTVKLYRDQIEGITEEDLVHYVKEDLSQNTSVNMLTAESVYGVWSFFVQMSWDSLRSIAIINADPLHNNIDQIFQLFSTK